MSYEWHFSLYLHLKVYRELCRIRDEQKTFGTLGCINDMLQRDKENRELRKLNRDRIKEHQKYLVNKGKGNDLSNISIEQMEEIHKRTIEKEALDNASLFKAKIYFIASILLLFLLAIVCYML